MNYKVLIFIFILRIAVLLFRIVGDNEYSMKRDYKLTDLGN